ncbi:hypothetical protein VNO77_44275 [Canavalia gladiata]|uniref:Uncharacterized protein n=1 Tax=Canavalia gladiata TaxID=3824 RepID=A0AAN9JXX9_CANGL
MNSATICRCLIMSLCSVTTKLVRSLHMKYVHDGSVIAAINHDQGPVAKFGMTVGGLCLMRHLLGSLQITPRLHANKMSDRKLEEPTSLAMLNYEGEVLNSALNYEGEVLNSSLSLEDSRLNSREQHLFGTWFIGHKVCHGQEIGHELFLLMANHMVRLIRWLKGNWGSARYLSWLGTWHASDLAQDDGDSSRLYAD